MNVVLDEKVVRTVNFQSDFDFVLTMKDCEGKVVPFPSCDWTAKFYTSSRVNAYLCSRKAGEYVNCFEEEDGKIHFVFNNHHLGMGRLQMQLHVALPNGIYADGKQDIYDPQPLDFELVEGQGDCATTSEIEAMLPYIKGDPFTYEDFTPEQLDDLARDAAGHVTIEDLGVATEQEIDEEMGKHLAENLLPEKSFRLDRRVRHGMMPAKARPGIMYYDYGWIKIKPWRDSTRFQREWDLSAFREEFDMEPEVVINHSGLPANKDRYEFDPYECRFTLLGDPETFRYETFYVKMNDEPLHKDGMKLYFFIEFKNFHVGTDDERELFYETDNPFVCYIGDDGVLHRKTMKEVGAKRYEAPVLPDSEVFKVANLLRNYEFLDKRKKLGIKLWLRKKTRMENGEWYRKKWAVISTMNKELKGTVFVCKIVRRSKKGYVSEPRFFSCLHNWNVRHIILLN